MHNDNLALAVVDSSTPARHKVKLMGKVIGKATDWHRLDNFTFVLNDYQPDPDVPLLAGDVTIDIIAGVMRRYDAKGEMIESIDILPNLPR